MKTKTTKPKAEFDLLTMMNRFGDEDKCRTYLEQLRWPDGVRCIRCQSDKISRFYTRNMFVCDSCDYQFSVKTGTIFHDSHLPLMKWFAAIYLMSEAKKGVSANQLKRNLGVAYKTAWYLCHRIRAAVKDADTSLLQGIVEVDETFFGGKAKNMHKKDRERKIQGRGTVGKAMALAAIQRGGGVRLCVEKTRDEYVRGDVHTNTVEGVFSLFKRSIVGAYHQVSVKHLDRYLDEFEFRFNNRNNPYLFRDTLLRLIASSNLEYKELTKEEAA